MVDVFGWGEDRNRTGDPPVTNRVLYQTELPLDCVFTPDHSNMTLPQECSREYAIVGLKNSVEKGWWARHCDVVTSGAIPVPLGFTGPEAQ